MWACRCSNKILQWSCVGLRVCFLPGLTTPWGSFIASPPLCVGFLQTTRRESPRGYLSSPSDGLSILSAPKSDCLTWVTRAPEWVPSLSAPWILVSYHSSTKGIIYCQAQGGFSSISSVAPPGRSKEAFYFIPEKGNQALILTFIHLNSFWMVLVSWSKQHTRLRLYAFISHRKVNTCRLVVRVVRWICAVVPSDLSLPPRVSAECTEAAQASMRQRGKCKKHAQCSYYHASGTGKGPTCLLPS